MYGFDLIPTQHFGLSRPVLQRRRLFSPIKQKKSQATMNLINMIITTGAILMAAFTPTALAQQMRGGGHEGGRGGPFGGGGGGGGAGSYVDFVSTICDGLTPTTCDIHPPRGGARGGGHGGGSGTTGSGNNITVVAPTSGIFVCRTSTNPRTQEVTTFSMCIPKDKGIVGDDCGCCDDVCPEPCECPCTLMDRSGRNPKVDANGDAIAGALVTTINDGTEDDEVSCVPKLASALLVERSNGAVTCATCV
jgi:hypothetical protein